MCFQRGEKYTQPSFVPPTCPAPWNWLAVGNGLPCNDFDWPIVSNLCSLLSRFVLNKGVSSLACSLGTLYEGPETPTE